MNSTVHYRDEQITLHLGDSLDVLPTMPDASVDAIVTDPPYGLDFMGAEWDSFGATGKKPRIGTADGSKFRQNRGTPSHTANGNPTCLNCSGDKYRNGPRKCQCPNPDFGNPGRQQLRAFQAWCEAWARECLRVLKPGGHLLAFGAPRTYHRLAAGIEDAGFEIRDSIHWVYGSGFPKSLDVAKAIDKAGGQSPADLGRTLRAARERAGLSRQQVADALGCHPASVGDWEDGRARTAGEPREVCTPSPAYRESLARLLGYSDDERRITGEGGGSRGLYETGHRGIAYGEPVTGRAQVWDGWGTALKPAHEPIVVARKAPGGTVAANVLEHGTGALNIDGCRALTGQSPSIERRQGKAPEREAGSWANDRRSAEAYAAEHPGESLGRWPANLVLTHAPGCREVGTRTVRNPSGSVTGEEPSALVDAVYAERKRVPYVARETETVPVWDCQPGCPVAELDRQSGAGRSRIGKPRGAAAGDGWGMTRTGAEYDDAGGSSRFFPVFRYEAKAPASERPRLADGTAHATVKPLDLMRWLVRLVTPPGGTVLDPFAGSGTTGEAAIVEGFNALLIERERPYADLIVARLSKPLQPTLFGEAA